MNTTNNLAIPEPPAFRVVSTQCRNFNTEEEVVQFLLRQIKRKKHISIGDSWRDDYGVVTYRLAESGDHYVPVNVSARFRNIVMDRLAG